MALNISYFAWVRERMGIAEEAVVVPSNVATISELVAWLAARDERGAAAFGDPSRIRAAIDGGIVPPDAMLGKDIALFPPVTGG